MDVGKCSRSSSIIRKGFPCTVFAYVLFLPSISFFARALNKNLYVFLITMCFCKNFAICQCSCDQQIMTAPLKQKRNVGLLRTTVHQFINHTHYAMPGHFHFAQVWCAACVSGNAFQANQAQGHVFALFISVGASIS